MARPSPSRNRNLNPTTPSLLLPLNSRVKRGRMSAVVVRLLPIYHVGMLIASRAGEAVVGGSRRQAVSRREVRVVCRRTSLERPEIGCRGYWF